MTARLTAHEAATAAGGPVPTGSASGGEDASRINNVDSGKSSAATIKELNEKMIDLKGQLIEQSDLVNKLTTRNLRLQDIVEKMEIDAKEAADYWETQKNEQGGSDDEEYFEDPAHANCWGDQGFARGTSSSEGFAQHANTPNNDQQQTSGGELVESSNAGDGKGTAKFALVKSGDSSRVGYGQQTSCRELVESSNAGDGKRTDGTALAIPLREDAHRSAGGQAHVAGPRVFEICTPRGQSTIRVQAIEDNPLKGGDARDFFSWEFRSRWQ